MNWSDIAEWLTLIIGLIFLTYTLIVIKEEKSSFLDSAKILRLNQYQFKIASWWSEKAESSNDQEKTYYRADTKYEWEAKFIQYKSEYNFDDSIENILKCIYYDLKIKFDSDACIIKNPSLFSEIIEKNPHLEIARIEGTGTQDEVDRIYADIFCIKDLDKKELLVCYSLSSVLNGSVEGPYFEESMKSLVYLN